MRAHAGPAGPPLPLAEVEALVDRFALGDGPPGLVYGLVSDGSLVHVGARGRRRLGAGAPDGSTVFRIASMTKSFTAAAVLLLRDEGALRLDDEVARHVPEAAALRPPTDDAPPLTVRALLTMTAGLPTDDPWGDRQQDLPDDEFAALVAAGLSFAWTPGTAYEYSNTGYALLGRVIAAAGGAPYAEVVTRRLLQPLGLHSTVFAADAVPADRLAQGYRPAGDGWEEVPFAAHGAYASMGGLFSTVEDLAVWVGGFAAAFPPRDGGDAHPLGRAARREQQQPHRGLPPAVTWRSVAEPPVVRGQAYGFGLVVEQDPRLGDLVSHSGGYPGFGSHMRWHPGSGLGVVVLGNATYAAAGRLGRDLLDLLLAHHPDRPAPAPVPRPDRVEGSMATATAAAVTDVNRLLQGWDDALAARLLAPNVDADEPLAARRAAIARIRADLGPLTPDGPVESTSPAHATWWLTGRGGRVRAEIRLTPQLPPLVQTLAVTAVPDPPGDVLDLARRLATALGTGTPGRAVEAAGWTLPPGEDDEARRALRVAAAWAGESRVAAVTGGDGVAQAAFRIEGRVPLLLALGWEPGTRRLTSLGITPPP